MDEIFDHGLVVFGILVGESVGDDGVFVFHWISYLHSDIELRVESGKLKI